MRLLAFLVGVTGSLATANAASPSGLDSYRGSARQFLVRAGLPGIQQNASAGLGVHLSAPLPVRITGSGQHASEEAATSPTAPLASVKSPVKAFFLSLLLPGLGEWYAGHRIRSAVFLAIEGTAWTTWGIYRGKGKDWETKFIDFQAEHWSFKRYNAYRHAVWDRYGEMSNAWDPSRPIGLRQQDSLTILVGSHHYDDCCGQPMPSDDDRLEMIGKYYRFSYGWDDAAIGYSGGQPVQDPDELLVDRFPPVPNLPDTTWGADREDWKTIYGGSLVTPAYNDCTGVDEVPFLDLVVSANREEYTRMRQKSNDAYGTASKMTTVILFNHVISAIHAARLARRANQSSELVEPPKTHLRMTLYRTERDMVPMLVFWRRL